MSRKPWLRVSTVAKILHIHRDTVYDLINDGELEAIRVTPRNIFVEEEKLQEFIDKKRTKPPS